MSDPHDHPHEPAGGNPSGRPLPAASPLEDSGSRALADALRSSFAIVKIIMMMLVIVFLGSGIFTVPPNQRAVVLRFGKPSSVTSDKLLGPGLHWSWPYPIDEVVKIPISEIQTVSSSAGWYFVNADGSESPVGMSLNPGADGYALTGDGNIIHARVTLDYRIVDPIVYVLNFTDARTIVTNALDDALIHAAAQFTVDDAVRMERGAFKDKVVQLFNRNVTQQQLGIVVESSKLESIAPRQVKEAFDAAIAAEQEASTTNNAAKSAATTLLGAALSESNSIVNAAITDRNNLLSRIAADAGSFEAQLGNYERNPQLFTELILTETWQKILATAEDKFPLLNRADGKPRELRLLLNREPETPEQRQRRRQSFAPSATATNAVPPR